MSLRTPQLAVMRSKHRRAILFPIIDTLLSELGQLAGSRLAQLSGAGPTCFALFETERAAGSAAAALEGRHPDWWIRSTRLA